MKILLVSLVSILILKTDAASAFESSHQLMQPAQSQDFLLPGVCEFNPDLPFCKRNPICRYEMQECEPKKILFCENVRAGDTDLICNIRF